MLLTQNPNFPLLRVLWSPTTNAAYDSNVSLYTDITLRCLDQWSVRRGRQYELGLTQPGTFQSTINNRDGAFNPVSSLSPLAPGVLPERSLTVEAQWPPTQQLLTGDMATAGDVSGLAAGPIPASFQASAFYATPGIVTSASAWQGTRVYQTSCGDADAAGFSLIQFSNQPVVAPTIVYPSLPYSWSVYVRSNTVGANPTVRAALAWKNSSAGVVSTVTASTVTLTGSASAGWQRLTFSASPPSGAVAVDLIVQLAATGPGIAWAFQADGLQFEQASSASTWTQPNPWYPIYAGNVTRYPNSYDLSGTRGVVKIQASDALALLSRSVITASLAGLIANPAGDNSLAGAIFNYWLGDAGGNQYADQLGNRNYGQGLPGKYGIGTITANQAVTSAIVGESFLGTTQTCVAVTSSAGAGQAPGAAMSAIAFPPGPNGQYGPGSGTGLGYTRMIAFKCTTAPSSASVLWYSGALGNYAQGFALFPSGVAAVSVIDANHSGNTTVGSYDVGGWHLAWLGVAADGSSFLAGIDGSVTSYSAGANDYAYPAGFLDELVGAQGISASNPNYIGYNFTGDLALYVEWPELLTSAAISSIYQAWRTGWTGDSTGQRAAHILGAAHFVGATAIDSGSTTSLAAATDVVQTDAVTALQDVQQTEGGFHFISAGGAFTLYGRARRLGAYAPVYTFGTNPAAGEIPFEDVAPDFDDTQISNNVSNTQTSTLQTFYAVNQASAKAFGASTLTLNNQSSNPQDAVDQANWYAGANGYPRLRVSTIALHPSANPSLMWPVCLSLELGMYVKTIQRPMGASVGAIDPVALTGFIENIQITGKGPDLRYVLQISPDTASGGGPSQPALRPWNLALLHTTLNLTAASGQPTITINALPTAATSTLAQNLPQGGPGFQLTIGDGLATQETKTILSVSTTTTGYTTATITFTSNLVNTHSPGEIVRELLGGASASTWQNLDAYSTLGSCMIAY